MQEVCIIIGRIVPIHCMICFWSKNVLILLCVVDVGDDADGVGGVVGGVVDVVVVDDDVAESVEIFIERLPPDFDFS